MYYDELRSAVPTAQLVIQWVAKTIPEKFAARTFSIGAVFCGELQQVGAPLRKNRSDLVRVFFGHKFVEAGLRFEKQSLERPWHSIARMQMEFASREIRCGGV